MIGYGTERDERTRRQLPPGPGPWPVDMMVRYTSLAALVLAATAAVTCDGSYTVNEARELSLEPAMDHLLDAFGRYPIVAFSEPRHAAGGTRELWAALLHDPRFASTVDDIVVEFGNARYQDLADRFVLGDHVSRAELKQIWENTTIVSGIWSAPLYEWFLAEVRALNAGLPEPDRVRVVLGDPPIDWTAVYGPADEDMNDWRDAHFAWAVEEHVFKRGRRALLWIGGAHLSRQVMIPESLIHLLDRRFPDRILVALALDRRDVDEGVVERLGRWPSLMAAPVRDTWLGGVDAASGAGMRLSTGTVEQNIDVAIFWEFPPRTLDEEPRIDHDRAYAAELRRRQELAVKTVAFRGGAIRFERERATITQESMPALEAVLTELRRDTTLNLIVKAFADARESEGAGLSRARARAVVDWLVQQGISRERLEPRGCGASRTLWIGVTEEQRSANRRAELVRRTRSSACMPPASFEARSAGRPPKHDDVAIRVLNVEILRTRSTNRYTVRDQRRDSQWLSIV